MTRRPLQQKAGTIFLALIITATMLLLVDVTIADTSAIRDSRYHWEVRANETVLYELQRASPGDVVISHYDHSVREPVARYDFLVTEPEDAARIAEGVAPRAGHVYREVTGITGADCCHRPPLHFTRPAAPEGEPDGRIALVWVYHHAEGTPAPATPDEQDALRTEIILATSGRDTAETLPSWAVQAHWILLGATVVAGIGAVVAGLYWLTRAGPRVSPPRRGEETEALVTLVTAGRDHLRALRGLLVTALAFLILTGIVVLTFFFLYLEDLVAPPSPHWHLIMRVGFLGVWLALLAAAGTMLARVQRTLGQWDAHLREDPLGL